jgi:hypothetical protein
MLEAERRVQEWLQLGEPLTFKNAKAHLGQHNPLVGNEKKFGHAMKAMGYQARRYKRNGKQVRVYEKGKALRCKLARVQLLRHNEQHCVESEAVCKSVVNERGFDNVVRNVLAV